MFALLLNDKRKMQISDVQLLLFYQPFSLTGNLNGSPGHWVWNLVLGEPQISYKRQKKEKKNQPTFQIYVCRNLLNTSST